MFAKILIGFDGTPESRDALALAGRIATRTGAELTVAVCFPQTQPLLPEHGHLLDEEAAPLFRVAHKLLPDTTFSTVVSGDPSPARALSDLAAEQQADVIVIGSTHRGAVGRVYPGSVGERLLHCTPAAVAVAPRDYASHRHTDIGVIGVAFDGTAESRLALAAAGLLAGHLGARVRVISVIDLRGRGATGFIEFSKVATGKPEADLEEAGRTLGPEIDQELALLEGDPAAILANEAVELDLLIVGSAGHGPLGHLLLGSVSGELMRTAPCPVMALPRMAHVDDPETVTVRPETDTS